MCAVHFVFRHVVWLDVPSGFWWVERRSHSTCRQSWQKEVGGFRDFAVHSYLLCSELEALIEALEDQVRQQNQVLREATAKHQNLLRHLKLIEDGANHEGQQHKLPHPSHLESLQQYMIMRCCFAVHVCRLLMMIHARLWCVHNSMFTAIIIMCEFVFQWCLCSSTRGGRENEIWFWPWEGDHENQGKGWCKL